jgi:hypothetical protein
MKFFKYLNARISESFFYFQKKVTKLQPENKVMRKTNWLLLSLSMIVSPESLKMFAQKIPVWIGL